MQNGRGIAPPLTSRGRRRRPGHGQRAAGRFAGRPALRVDVYTDHKGGWGGRILATTYPSLANKMGNLNGGGIERGRECG